MKIYCCCAQKSSLSALFKDERKKAEVVMDRVSKIGFSGSTWNQPKNGFKRRGEKDFFRFLPYLLLCGRFSEPSAHSTLKNLQIFQKFGKNDENPCSTCPRLKPISPSHIQNRKNEFRVGTRSITIKNSPIWPFLFLRPFREQP